MSLEEKIDKILQNQAYDRVVMARMETDLRHHIKRSDAHELQLKDQQTTITRLWFAIAALFGAGAGNAGPAIMKWLGGIL